MAGRWERRFSRKWFFYLLVLFACSALHAQQQGTVTYVYTDQNNNVLAETDAQGNITATNDYTPYGTTALGTPPTGPGYAGHVNDPETNLVYMQARYYDPATGHFLSIDPDSLAPGDAFKFNRYSYANNNPILNVDPNGRETGAGYGNGEYGVYAHTPTQSELHTSDEIDDAADQLLQPLVAEVPELDSGAAFIAEARVVSTVEIQAAATDLSDVPHPSITAPYVRPDNATSAAQRALQQGHPCVTCGEAAAKMVADHKTPLVEEYYKTGTIDLKRMKSPESVQPQCPKCSAKQGAKYSKYSKQMKKIIQKRNAPPPPPPTTNNHPSGA